ncbi:MAG: septum formation initiator [Azospirillaceae bacterium]|nr:septum formation initiator [Azospirillaceae bacterium]
MRIRVAIAVLFAFCVLARGAQATEAAEGQTSVTHHTLDLADGPLNYTATAAFLPVLDDRPPGHADPDKAGDGGDKAKDAVAETERAKVFTVSYVVDGGDAAQRPVTFVFNGGPGAASAYLHLGAVGPRVLAFGEDGSLPAPPPHLQDNPDTWLRFTDLVFIDPVATGFSRLTRRDDDAGRSFFSVEGDATYLAGIVRLWLARNDRWGSPKYLAGESYGGFRSIFMARELQRHQGITVNGLVMVSPLLDQVTIDDDAADLLSWAVHLPAMAAIARQNGRGDPDMDPHLVETFALSDYLTGLATRTLADPTSLTHLYATVARLTGLPLDQVERYRGEIPIRFFAHELLHDKGAVISLYDGTFSAPDGDPAADGLAQDPLLDGSIGAYATGFNLYAQSELGFHTGALYRLLDTDINRRWDWGRKVGYAGAIEALQTLFNLAPHLRILVAHGRFDLVTPWMGSQWLLGRLVVPEAARHQIELKVYDGGHMLYMHAPSRHLLSADVRDLIEDPSR